MVKVTSKRVGRKLNTYDIYGSGFIFSEPVVNMVSWDFDGDGDLDISGTTVGMYYSGSAHTVWANDGKGNFTV